MQQIHNHDDYFMSLALHQAKNALKQDEVPIGSIIVQHGIVIASGYNKRESERSALSHAEINAIYSACELLNGWRLPNCTLYVTIEPCPMCAGAILQSRIDRVVFGAPDLKAGCAGTLYNLLTDNRFNHHCSVTNGILEAECADIIRNYFKAKRQQQKRN